ncbi:hypothetical protein, partial [Klebsiella aerogenes]|uniref:hypothetical protein n=1 Tax=Klebsiella aerogenes TaxID=548 RepID=UPI0019538276
GAQSSIALAMGSGNLSTRWPLAQKLFAHELARASLDARRVNLGWHQAKSYVGITYMYANLE